MKVANEGVICHLFVPTLQLILKVVHFPKFCHHYVTKCPWITTAEATPQLNNFGDLSIPNGGEAEKNSFLGIPTV